LAIYLGEVESAGLSGLGTFLDTEIDAPAQKTRALMIQGLTIKSMD
jgi:hypothetical protein